jgi:uncharacterized protein (DUF362 family)
MAKFAVSVVKCEHYDADLVEKSLDRAVQLVGGWGRYVKKGARVLVKPNLLSWHSAEDAVTTHPIVVEKILERLLELGAKPSVGDSPAAGSAEQVADKSGILAVCRRHKVPLIELTTPKLRNNPDGMIVKEFPISVKLMEFDTIINVPKLKTHMLTVYTGAVKNLFGCIPGKVKSNFHMHYGKQFNEMLLDLYLLLRPQLTIMDAVIGMQGFGPSYGEPVHLGMLLAGNDALAVDCAATSIIGITAKVPMMHAARMRRLDAATMSNILLTGDTINIRAFKTPGFASLVNLLRSRTLNRLAKVLGNRPAVAAERCTACGNCADVCSSHAITVGKTACINYGKCRRCFCCYEVCPNHAIVIQSLFSLQRFK